MSFSLALIGSHELADRVSAYSTDEIEKEIARCNAQQKVDDDRRTSGYKGMVSTPGFWAERVAVLTAALNQTV